MFIDLDKQHYHMSILENKQTADHFRREKKYDLALEIYRKLWDQDKNAWNGYFVALCFRQSGRLVECREFHDEFDKMFPGMQQMKTERLWLDYRQYVKDYDYADFVEAGTKILAHSNQYSKDTDKVYIKTVLAVAQRLSSSPTEKLEWLDKLDHGILGNDVFRINDIAYPADRKRYFLEYAQCLIDLDIHNVYVAEKMALFGFYGVKHNEFFAYLSKGFTYTDFNGRLVTSKLKLALVLKILAEELDLRRQKNMDNAYIKNKGLTVSDLSHYTFCPASYAIHRTFKIYSSESWQKDEWKKEKLYLADRHKLFLAKGTLEEAFSDTTITIDTQFREKFNAIFSSKVELNNATSKEPTVMKSSAGDIYGAPDYLFLHRKNLRFVITEKFSHKNSADSHTPFDSDLIKQYTFLQEFNNYRIDFGLFLTWYYSHEEVQDGKEGEKKIVVNSYRLTKICLDEKARKLVKDRIDEVRTFNEKGKLKVNGQQLSYPPKCLNCSVVSYCHHKTGQFDEINMPYEIQPLRQT